VVLHPLLHLVVVALLPLLQVAVVLPLLRVVVVLPLLRVVVVLLPLLVVVVALPLLQMLEIEVIYSVLFRLLIREVYEKRKPMIKVHLSLEEIQIEVVQLVVLEEALVVEEAEVAA
jgi:hypothetical protein